MNVLNCVPIREAVRETGDYMEGGFLHCGKCRKPKQMRVRLDGRDYTVPVLCACAEEARREEERQKERRRLEERVARLRREGITDRRYLDMTFQRSDAPLDFAESYVRQWPRFEREGLGLLLMGGVGTGKTFAAACIANALLDQGVSVRMANIVAVCGCLGGLYGAQRDACIESLQRVRLLILDDFGAERSSDFVQEQIYNVVEARYRSGKPLVVTSNLTPAQLRGGGGDIRFTRVYDRLKEMCHPVELSGDSRRRRIANDRYREVEEALRGGRATA